MRNIEFAAILRDAFDALRRQSLLSDEDLVAATNSILILRRLGHRQKAKSSRRMGESFGGEQFIWP